MTKPIVAIVGRPNVGKSTLFNRLIGQPLAIVEDIPGTTRDRLYADTEWNGVPFTLVDTGGLEIEVAIPGHPHTEGKPPPLSVASPQYVEQIRAQAQVAIAEADAIIFMVDVIDGLVAGDEDVADVLRRSQKPLFLAVNKADNQIRREAAVEFYALGLGDPYPISALHGTGTGDLLDDVVASFPIQEAEETEAIRIAIVGRPNVGKSSLLNKLLGQERAIVSAIPGTTRDAIDTYLEWEREPIVLIDTAGIRRRGRIERGLEQYSVLRALRAIQRADVVLLLVEATEVVTAQDAHIAGYILEEAKSVVVVVNKWDLVDKDTHTMVEYTKRIRADLKFLDYVPVLFISALTGQRVNKVLPTALRVQKQRLVRIPTSELNRIMMETVARHSPPSKRGKRLKFYYATQAAVDPPTFVFFVNDPRLVHFSYERYIENQLRERSGFEGTPLRLSFRRRTSRF
ncbi:MAG: GTP-binding protein Der [candidate division Zixibacteria bacterium SM23_81]|nr:MAG: GTP-binding protein Der [candidate division Zixibacteria bacterium SM23_81]